MALITPVKGNTPISRYFDVCELVCPANTGENTLLTITLPAKILGKRGSIEIYSWWDCTNNVNAKTPRIKFGGTTLLTGVMASTAMFSDRRVIMNRNAWNSQRTFGYVGTGGWHTGSTASSTMAIDTSATVDVVFTAQLGVGTDTLTLQAYDIHITHRT